MGRKSQAKQNAKKGMVKENSKFVLQKRKDLAVYVDRLLKLTSLFPPTININKIWEQHLEIESILTEIKNIEKLLSPKQDSVSRQENIDKFLSWLKDNDAKLDGVEISEFEGYGLGLRAVKEFKEDSLILTIPHKLTISPENARESDLGLFMSTDPLLTNMPHITLALFLLLEKNKPDSFWKPYIDILPDKYSTVLYFSSEEFAELKPSPAFDSGLKLCRSIARQYAYFYNKVQDTDLGLKRLQDIFSYENYRWAVTTVMTRQNSLYIADAARAFIPLWDLCNHEDGKNTTDFCVSTKLVECRALRDFQPGEQIFIFYGVRSNTNLFLHNGFVDPQNSGDSLSIPLGVSTGDPLRATKLVLMKKLGLNEITHYSFFKGAEPISPEMRAFARIFNMNQDELAKWSDASIPADLTGTDAQSLQAVGADLERRACGYLLTRSRLILASYKNIPQETPDEMLHRKNIRLLKQCEVQLLDGAIKYLQNTIDSLPTDVPTTN